MGDPVRPGAELSPRRRVLLGWGGGGGLEPKGPKVCVAKTAQINVSFCKIPCFPTMTSGSEGGGGAPCPPPPPVPHPPPQETLSCSAKLRPVGSPRGIRSTLDTRHGAAALSNVVAMGAPPDRQTTKRPHGRTPGSAPPMGRTWRPTQPRALCRVPRIVCGGRSLDCTVLGMAACDALPALTPRGSSTTRGQRAKRPTLTYANHFHPSGGATEHR